MGTGRKAGAHPLTSLGAGFQPPSSLACIFVAALEVFDHARNIAFLKQPDSGNPGGARQRLEKVIKDYPRAPVIPEALSLLADVNFSEGRDREAVDLLRQLANDYSYTEWGKRAAQRLRAQR